MNNPQQPREYDAVLGGNSPSLEGAAVLGGIEGVKLRLQNPDAKVRIAALEQALNYGEQGLDLVIAGLKDESWDIQNAAYLILNKRTEPRIKQILQNPRQLGFKLEQIEVLTVNKFGEIIQRQPRIARYFLEDLGNGVKLEMAAIPGGTFMMGSPDDEKERWHYESPQHEVTVPDFFMGKYPVTQAQYQAIMGNNRSHFKGENRPVETVRWNDAVKFCELLSQRTGKKYTLPSEAQWEYACRAGTTTPFYFGETITTDLANYDGNYTYASAPQGEYRRQTTDVGTFPPNAFGLYDMHGNVWEWCFDNWVDNYNNAPTNGSAVTSSSNKKLLRGGSWIVNPEVCRSARRVYDVAGFDYDDNGFRVVCGAAPLKQDLTDYTRLRDFLAAGKWKEADEETARVMLTVVKRNKEAWLDVEHINNFPCKDIRIIDQLWMKYSNRRFGFSVQKRIYQSLGGTTKYNYKIWCKFADYVGWRKGEKWLYYSDIKFDIRASEGHLPLVGAVVGERIPPGWGEFGVPLWGLSPLVLRLVSCNI